MSNNRLKFEGLDELKASLRRLPFDLRDEASLTVEIAAEDAAEVIRSKYPRRTGNLAEHVEVQIVQGSRAFAGAIIKNTAKHSFIFENGTQARHTDIGANRGSMPPGHVFIPAVIRARRTMYERLRDMLRRKGLKVIG